MTTNSLSDRLKRALSLPDDGCRSEHDQWSHGCEYESARVAELVAALVSLAIVSEKAADHLGCVSTLGGDKLLEYKWLTDALANVEASLKRMEDK